MRPAAAFSLALDESWTDPTPNDPGDEDEGPKRLEDFPELVSASQNCEAPIEFEYFVDSIPGNSGYPTTVDFYVADVNDQAGRSWIASDEFEAADFMASEPVGFSIFLSFTDAGPHELIATDAEGNTTEFSPPVTVPEPRMGAAFAALALSGLARRRRRGREAEGVRRGRGPCRGTPVMTWCVRGDRIVGRRKDEQAFSPPVEIIA